MSDPFPRWSKSGISSLIEGCRWQVYLKKVVGLPDPGGVAATVGTAYHAAIENHERARLAVLRDWQYGPPRARAKDLPTRTQTIEYGLTVLGGLADELPAEVFERQQSSREAMASELEAAILNWWDTPIPDGQDGQGNTLRQILLTMRPLAIEPYFVARIPASPRPLHGFIDGLYWSPAYERYVTVDHKTASNWKSWPLSGGGHELEAAVYTVGATVSAALPARGEVVHEWHVARRNFSTDIRFQGVRRIAAGVTDMERHYLDGQVRRADQIVDGALFNKNPDWFLCSPKWCPFHIGNGGPCDPEVPAEQDPLRGATQ